MENFKSIDRPLVSICCTTFNHEKYIKECLEGFLIQQTNFPFEILVFDDASTDRNQDIIKEFAQKHDNITTFLQTENQWSKKKYGLTDWLFPAAQGKYIALCEGDDYWTDPLKLQKQVDFLEASPHLVACHHWQKVAVNKGVSFEEIEAPKEGHGYFPFETSVKSIFENKMRVKVRTVMFRNVFEPSEILLNFPKAVFGDVPLSFVLGKYGRFGFIDEEMAVYRQTNTGVSTAGLEELGWKKFKVQHFKNWIQIWDYADRFYEFKYHKEATETVLDFYKTITDNLPKTIGSFIKVLYYNIFKRKLPFRHKFASSKWIFLFYFKKIGSKVKRKLQFT